MVLLGTGLFLAISHQYASELDASLRVAASLLEGAARTRELEAGAAGRVVDAVDELQIPDRSLYLLDATPAPVTPLQVPSRVLAAARAAWGGSAMFEATEGEDHWRLYAERFVLAGGTPMVAVAAADKVELEDRYAALITAFGVAAVIALVLVTAGGWILVRQSTAPLDRSIVQMQRFMADAAHELRTPITVLRTQAEVALQQERSSAEYIRSLLAIESESRRMGRVVDDLLLLARADSGQRLRQFSRVFLDDVVMDAVEAAGALATARQLSLVLREFDEAPVNGDPDLLRQLVMILLDNALKFTPAGGAVTVMVGMRDGGAVITVADTGPGIAAEDQPHVFERFYRGDLARSRGDTAHGTEGGAGLGLSIAQWIVDEHRAGIQLEARPGGGTLVTVRFLPAPPAEVSSS